MDNRQERKELAALILSQLGVLHDYVRSFINQNIVTSFESPLGIGYYIDKSDEKMTVINDMENDGLTVYAVVHGTYRIGDDDIMEATTYLYIDDTAVKTYHQNIANNMPVFKGICDNYEGMSYSLAARCDGFDTDYGDVGILGRYGGLIRLY